MSERSPEESNEGHAERPADEPTEVHAVAEEPTEGVIDVSPEDVTVVAPASEDNPVRPLSVADGPDAPAEPIAEPEPLPPPAASFEATPVPVSPSPSGSSSLPLPDNVATLVSEKPEVLVGGAFLGGLVVAQILKRLGS